MDLQELLRTAQTALANGADPRNVDTWVAKYTPFQTLAELASAAQSAAITPRNLGREAVQGATMGFGDELLGLRNAAVKNPEARERLFAAISAIGRGGPAGFGAPEAGANIGAMTAAPEYAAGRDPMRRASAVFREAHPVIAAGSGIAGAMAMPLGVARGPLSAGKTILTGMGVGGVGGAISGAGESEATTPAGIAADAVGGGVVGTVGGAALSGLGAGVQRLRTPRGIAPVADAIERNRAEIEQFLADAARTGRGDVAVLSDASHSLRKLLDRAVVLDPEVTGARAVRQFEARATDAPERLAGDVRALAGRGPLDAATRAEELAGTVRAIENHPQRGYPALGKIHSPIVDPRVNDLLKEAGDQGLLTGRAALFAKRLRADGPTFAHLNNLRREADALARSNFDAAARGQGGNTALGADYRKLADNLRDVLEDNVPGFRSLQAETGAAIRAKHALGEGIEAFNRADPREFAEMVKRLTPPELEQFRFGLASELVNTLASRSLKRDAATELLNAGGGLKTKLRHILFGDDAAFRDFMRRAEIERAMRLNAGAGGGSLTAERTLGADVLGGSVPPVTKFGALSRVMQSLAQARGRGTARAAGGPLLEQGVPDFNEFIRDILARRRSFGARPAAAAGGLAGYLGGR